MAIEGSLESVDIQDIVQLLNLNRSTGLLHIADAFMKGVIYYRDGDIVQA
jgi:NADP-dependent 3-hydroxy acid dehydrogenase YdfG